MEKIELSHGDKVVVHNFGESIEGKEGKVVGLTTDHRARHVVDLWIVDFGERISDEYPFPVCTIPHTNLTKIRG